MENPTVVFRGPEDVALEDRPKPEPEAGEMLVETSCSLISTGTELTILAGRYPEKSIWADYGRYPFVAGYCNVGRVAAVGPGVDADWVGKRVTSSAPHARYGIATLSSTQALTSDRVTDTQGAFRQLGATVMNGVRRGRVGWGESVVIYGAGILGQLAARFCLLCGAKPVIVVEPIQTRLDLLPRDRSLIGVNPKTNDCGAVVAEATRCRMADVVFEVTGNENLLPQELQSLRQQGRFVILSSPRGPSSFDFHDLCNGPSYTIIGAHVSSHPKHGELDCPWTHSRNSEFFFDLVADGQLALDPLVSHRRPYTEAADLYRMLLRDRSQAMAVILEWSD